MTWWGTRGCRSRLRQWLANSWLTTATEDKVQLFILILKGILQNKITILFSTDSVFFFCEDQKENSFDSCKFQRENSCLVKLDSVRISRPVLNKKLPAFIINIHQRTFGGSHLYKSLKIRGICMFKTGNLEVQNEGNLSCSKLSLLFKMTRQGIFGIFVTVNKCLEKTSANSELIHYSSLVRSTQFQQSLLTYGFF